MDPIILFYDNALIYSPNIFFIFLLLLCSFIFLTIVNIPTFFIKIILHIIKVKKGRIKTKNNRIKLMIKVINKTYMILYKKMIRIILFIRKIVEKVKKEVFVEEGSRA